MSAAVEVFRDAYGIPHARARSTEEAFFAQGYVHAQDRLWQMQADVMRAAGRLAEYLGEDALTSDVFMRRMGLSSAAHADLDALDAPTRAVLDAYAAGVNAAIEDMDEPPVEFRLLDARPARWEPWHCAAVLKVRHVLMGTMHVKLWRAALLRALGPDAAKTWGTSAGREHLLIMPVGAREVWDAGLPDAFADGSNNWGVHGSRTASGLPLLAGDPHRSLEIPNVYYQNHLACPAFDAIGLSIPGVPGIFHFGHNATAAWCITHAMADTQDLYLERPEDVVERREEVIDVRGRAPIMIEVATTRNGPIVFEDPLMSLRWTGTDRPNTTLNCIVPILTASTVAELDEAMRDWVDPCNSVVMADRDGTLGYLHRGRVPVRDPANGWGPVPGWMGAHAWHGDVPFDELPRMSDPNPGYIATANNRVVGAGYPHYLGMDYAAPNRAQRLLERLAALDRATAEDMAAIHADRMSLAARAIVDAMRRADPAAGSAAARARDLLLAWDGTMAPDSAAAAICAAVREELTVMALQREPLKAVVVDPFPEDPDPTPAHRRIRGAIGLVLRNLDDATIGQALARAAAALGDPDTWRWDRVHTTRVVHPLSGLFPDADLDPPWVGVGGDADCVQAASDDIGLGVDHTAVARYVFDVADWDRSGWVVPFGASGDPASAHYADQTQAWRDVRLIPMTFSWPLIEQQAESRQALEPR